MNWLLQKIYIFVIYWKEELFEFLQILILYIFFWLVLNVNGHLSKEFNELISNSLMAFWNAILSGYDFSNIRPLEFVIFFVKLISSLIYQNW